MVEPGERASDGKITILLHNGHRYAMEFKHRLELLDYFRDPEIPSFIFETTDGQWVALQKGAIAAIEWSEKADRIEVKGFSVIGDKPE